MTKNQAKWLERIQALLAKAMDSASTESEASAAMAMAESLMEKHGITADALKAAPADTWVEHVMPWAVDKTGTKYMPPVHKYLAKYVSLLCGSTVFVKVEEGLTVIFGQSQDVELTAWLLCHLQKSLDEAWLLFKEKRQRDLKDYRLVTLKDARISFIQSFCGAVGARIKLWLAKRNESAEASGSTSLIVVKGQAVEEALAAKYGAMGKANLRTATRGRDSAAMGAGSIAGNGVTLGRGVQSGGTLAIGRN